MITIFKITLEMVFVGVTRLFSPFSGFLMGTRIQNHIFYVEQQFGCSQNREMNKNGVLKMDVYSGILLPFTSLLPGLTPVMKLLHTESKEHEVFTNESRAQLLSLDRNVH